MKTSKGVLQRMLKAEQLQSVHSNDTNEAAFMLCSARFCAQTVSGQKFPADVWQRTHNNIQGGLQVVLNAKQLQSVHSNDADEAAGAIAEQPSAPPLQPAQPL